MAFMSFIVLSMKSEKWFKNEKGRVETYKPNHPNSNYKGYLSEHVLIATKILGKPLPEGAVIHHINNNHYDNRPCNLMICESFSYHQVLHEREKAFKACGHATWRKCVFCKTYDKPKNLKIRPNPGHAYHARCKRRYSRARKRRLSLLKIVGLARSQSAPEPQT